MQIDLITKQDLEQFKSELILEISKLIELKKNQLSENTKVWIGTKEVKEILGISSNTLAMYRKNNTIPFKKIYGKFFYKQSDVEQLNN
jgi:hypothetical protein